MAGEEPGFRILLIQQISDLSNILARIADFASNLGGSTDLYTPVHPPPGNKDLNIH
jgi:hypothetical protein